MYENQEQNSQDKGLSKAQKIRQKIKELSEIEKLEKRITKCENEIHKSRAKIAEIERKYDIA